MRHLTRPFVAVLLSLLFVGVLSLAQGVGPADRQWLAGDSHIHSHWSPGYDRTKNPPEPIQGQDAVYSTPTNARKAREYGLSWMVTTDHGGPNHSKFNLVHAYAELKESRAAVPDLLQFYGMELNMPAMDHHTLILPQAEDEWKTLFNIESQFDSNEAWPVDPAANTEAAAFRALMFMNGLPRLPLMFANHPSRSATGVRTYGLDEPHEFRNNNSTAPAIYRGMEGAPGHQAAALAPDGSMKRGDDGQPAGSRGAYGNPDAGTFGGFDQMTAILGGLWDALLGEGRRFWIVATSDSHVNYADTAARPGSDFWPGQYQKTYVLAHKAYDDVLDGLREGRIFVVAGDLVTDLSVTATSAGASANIGGSLDVRTGSTVAITIRFSDPESLNAHGENPRVARVDLIVGDITGPAPDRHSDTNGTTRVLARFTERDWKSHDDIHTITMTIPVTTDIYLRVRATSTAELEPTMDAAGEDPWADLWAYSNPIFLKVR